MAKRESSANTGIRRINRVWLANLSGWFTLAAVFVIFVLYFPSYAIGIETEPGLLKAYPAVEGFLSAAQFGTYLLTLRILAAMFILPAAMMLLIFGNGRVPIVAASILISSSAIVTGLAGDVMGSPGPVELQTVLDILNVVIILAFITGMFTLAHLYPDASAGRKWLRSAAKWAGGALMVWMALLFTGVLDSVGEFAWTVFLVLLSINLILAGQSIIMRLFRRTPAAGAARGLAALAVLFAWLLMTVFLGESIDKLPTLKLLSLHFDLFVIVFLAAGFLTDLGRNEQWNVDLRSHRRAILIAWAGFVVLAGLFAAVSTGRQRSALAAEQSAAEQLTSRDFGAVLVDTDMGNDDVLALLYLMEHPGVELQAVTVVGTGLVHCEPGVRNALGLLELAEYAEIPVSCGSEIPFGAEHEFPSSWRSDADRLWGFGLQTGGREPASLPAPDLIAGFIRDSPEPVNLLALGPLTNIAEVFQREPALVDQVGMLYVMGGAVRVPGNVYDENLGFDNQTAEWNIYADPVAARMVFETGVPITLIPLDATDDAPVDLALYQQFENHHDTSVSTFVFNIFYINQGWISSGYYYLWDTLAAAAMTAPELVTIEIDPLEVVTEAGPDYGRTRVSDSGQPVRVAVGADKPLFDAMFARMLASP